MRKHIISLALLSCLCLVSLDSCRGKKERLHNDTLTSDNFEETVDSVAPPAPTDIPRGAAILMAAYPDAVKSYDREKGTLLMANGEQIVYDDGREKDFVFKLDHSDPEDMFSLQYTRTGDTPQYLADAGRSRCEGLFKAMYGHDERQVRANLVPVDWLGTKVMFNSHNGAADSLAAVARELKAHPELKQAASGPQTFYWRKVRGAERLSAHAYGIAIDVGVPMSDYWLWANPGMAETAHIGYKNRMPLELVRIFERHGFIWGGNWYHYDTMHFEFRPEILASIGK